MSRSSRNPIGRYGDAVVYESAAGDCGVVHRPLTDKPVVAAQEDVALAITAEIADARNLPIGSHGMTISIY
jgi:hypothetical protein